VSEPTIKQMREQLLAAGWKSKTRSIWASPQGQLFLGPYGAWKVLRDTGCDADKVIEAPRRRIYLPVK